MPCYNVDMPTYRAHAEAEVRDMVESTSDTHAWPVRARDLYATYLEWWEANRHTPTAVPPLTEAMFGRIVGRYLIKQRLSAGIVYHQSDPMQMKLGLGRSMYDRSYIPD